MPDVKLPFLRGLEKIPAEHKPEDMAILRQWADCQKHLPPLTDNHLHLFYHSNYCRMERTKTTIEAYFTIRTNSSDLFSKWDPQEKTVQQILTITRMIRSSRKTPEGHSILLYRLADCDSGKFDFNGAMRTFFMFNDMILSEDGLSPGYIVVLDMKGVTLGHMSTVSISSIRVFMHYIQDAHPARLIGVHVINSVSFIDKVLMLVKPFIKGELMSLLHFHNNPEGLSKYLPMETLPSDYGGKGEDTDLLHAKYRALIEKEYPTFFQEENTLRNTDGKRRNSKNSQPEKLFGTQGSFRSLAID